MQVSGLARSGGEAKALCQEGKVRLNGARDTRRSHALSRGDVVEVEGRGSARVATGQGDEHAR